MMNIANQAMRICQLELWFSSALFGQLFEILFSCDMFVDLSLGCLISSFAFLFSIEILDAVMDADYVDLLFQTSDFYEFL